MKRRLVVLFPQSVSIWPQYPPRFARSLAVSFPIPVFAPVTIAVFPSKRISDDQLLMKSPLKRVYLLQFNSMMCDIKENTAKVIHNILVIYMYIVIYKHIKCFIIMTKITKCVLVKMWKCVLSICLSVSLSVRPSVHPSIHPSIYLS